MDDPPAGEPVDDRNRPSPARIYDWLLGGSYNFAVDRQVGEQARAILPELPRMLRANRAFLGRAVRYAAADGITQFLDLGSGLPTVGNVHSIANRVAADARVVYVDIDDLVVRTSEMLLADEPRVRVLRADLLDAEAVLSADAVRELIDWSRPVAILALAVAHFIPDTARLRGALARYQAAAAPGSILVLSHGNAPAGSDIGSRIVQLYARSGTPLVPRDTAEVAALLNDWCAVEPGIVTTSRWRSDAGGFGNEDDDPLTLAVVARK
jgi:hypothetical protein